MKLYAISLTTSLDRRRVLAERCEELSLELTFFDAINGRNGFAKTREHQIDREGAKKRLGKTMTDAEIACALSHALLCKEIAADITCEGAIILEDDAILSDDFGVIVKKGVLPLLGEDLIILYHSRARVIKEPLQPIFRNYRLRRPIRHPSGAVAYYVSRKGAQIIYDNSIPIAGVADWGFDISVLDVKCIDPIIVDHPEISETQSTIESQKNTSKISLLSKLKDRSYLRYMLRKITAERIS